MARSTGIIVLFGEQKVTLQIIQTATVTIVDMISNIGGTLGLFCGFSILSLVEVAYWMGRATARKVKQRPRRGKKSLKETA